MVRDLQGAGRAGPVGNGAGADLTFDPVAEADIKRAIFDLPVDEDRKNRLYLAATDPAFIIELDGKDTDPNDRSGVMFSWAIMAVKGSVASILGAPSYLSGLADKDMGILRAQAERKWAPIDTEQLAATRAVLARVEFSGGRVFERFTAVLSNRDAPTLKAGDSIKRLAG